MEKSTSALWRATLNIYAVIQTRLLLDNGADVNQKENEGNSPLCVLVESGYRDCLASVHLLLKRGARINEVNGAGNTALHKACMRSKQVVHKACMRKSKDVVDLLVKFGADMNVPNRMGKTALQVLKPNRPPGEAIAKIIIREAVKRESLGQHICEKNRQIIQSYASYSEFDQKCREEIKRMRNEKIEVEDSVASFFDIFSKNEKKLATLARNKNIVTAFETSDCMALFRIYAADLTTKFGKAKRRANILISIEDCLVDVLGDMLAIPILQKIAAYIEDDNTIENKFWNNCD